ncbi:MAG: zinc-dependent metalloprotease [Proteobacteria bacterium]|nr:zinc-dependent metalloprotease [Pseudomonadota bacterium]
MTLRATTSSLSSYTLLALSAAMALGGCTTYMTTPGNSAAAAAAPANGASAPFTAVANARPDPGAPKPFDEVVKGATRQDGFIPIWRKDEKVWLEIPQAMLDHPFLFSANISHSVGEKGLFSGQMGPMWLAMFRKIGAAQIQLVALNTEFAATNPQIKSVIEQSYSPSLLGSSAILSAPHPERKSVLIDASFLLSDIPGYSTALEAAFRLPLGLDRGNSFFEKTRATGDLTTLATSIHFATPRLPAPPPVPTPVVPTPPRTTPDPRSLFVGFVYSFTKLPDEPMRPRVSDPRLGYFTEDYEDLDNDLKVNPRRHIVQRWRLEKSDPSAAVSDVKEPIVFWLDKNVPAEYRKSVEAGVLEWNKAFEKIGLRNALAVQQQPDDADFDTLDSRHASIRWFSAADLGGGLAQGPRRADPRTGEIIDADIIVSESFARVARRLISEDAPPVAAPPVMAPTATWLHGHEAELCDVAEGAASELDFALDVMEARGDIEPGSPEAEAYVQEVIKSTVMHEVGHALGLKHNFKGSTIYTEAQLKDKSFTDKNGVSGSIMDYNAVNLPLDGERPTTLTQGQLGPYDYWAIEYAYKPIAPENEKAELAKIAARSTEPLLAYADDTEAGGIPGNDGIDPRVNRFDLGDDPLAYYQRRLQLSRELWQRVQDRGPRPGDDPLRQRRSLLAGFAQLRNAADLVGKYVGGMYTVRDIPGTTRRVSFTPVDPAKQRDALQFLAKGLFNANSFRFRPDFLADLTPDFNEWDRGGLVDVPSAVLRVQSAALDRLMSPGTASRLLNLPYYADPAKRGGATISLADVYGTLQGSIWSELKTGSEIDRLRRNLQRNYLSRVQNLLIHGTGTLPPDALSLVRLSATDLQTDLRRAADNPRLSVETRAHLLDSLAQITEALRASMLRS